MTIERLIVLAIGFSALAPHLAHTAPRILSSTSPAQCEALSTMDFAGIVDAPTEVLSAKFVRANGRVPAHCQVESRVTSEIYFEVRLPLSAWNQKFLVLANSNNRTQCNPYLTRGYACTLFFRNWKQGRKDFEWLALQQQNPKFRLDLIRSTHIQALSSKAIVTRYYSAAPQHSYFMGCSSGGYQAMSEAQTFPWDFDGIVAGAPAFDLAEYFMRAVWTVRQYLDDAGQPLFSEEDIQVLHRSVLGSCDKDDGVNDGIIGNPVGCKPDLSTLVCKTSKKADCLTQAQVNAAQRIYDGPTNAAGDQTSTPSVLPGSELSWSEFGPDLFEYAKSYLAFALYGISPELNPKTFDFDQDYKRLGLGAVLAPPTNPDLRKFKSAGGKLIAYQGGNDASHVGEAIIDYYETVERTMGGRQLTGDFFRLFLIPGMSHCSGGEGAYAIDYLTYLEDWVERSNAPDLMIGSHISDAAEGSKFLLDPTTPVAFTRPVYPYPLFARYKGSGDPKNAANFRPVNPSPTAVAEY